MPINIVYKAVSKADRHTVKSSMYNPLLKHDFFIARKVLISILLPVKLSLMLLVFVGLLIFSIYNVGVKLNTSLLSSEYRWLFITLLPLGVSLVVENCLANRVAYFRTRSPLASLAANKTTVRTYKLLCRAGVLFVLALYLAVVTHVENMSQGLTIIFVTGFGYALGILKHSVTSSLRRYIQKIASNSAQTISQTSQLGAPSQSSALLRNSLYRLSAARQVFSLKFLHMALGIIILVPILVFCTVRLSPESELPVIYIFSSLVMMAMLTFFTRADPQFVRFCAKFGFGYLETVRAHSLFIYVFTLALFTLAVFDFILRHGFYLFTMLIIAIIFQAYMALKIAYFRFRSKTMASLALQKDVLVISFLSILFFPLTFVFVFLLVRRLRPLASARFLERA